MSHLSSDMLLFFKHETLRDCVPIVWDILGDGRNKELITLQCHFMQKNKLVLEKEEDEKMTFCNVGYVANQFHMII